MVHECLLHVDEEHCGVPSRDWIQREEVNMIKLNKKEQESLLKKYAELERSIKPKDDCLIGSGYNNCKDLGFSAVDLFHAISPEITALQESKGEDLKPRIHD